MRRYRAISVLANIVVILGWPLMLDARAFGGESSPDMK